ncbi:hypothetical protein DY000_02027157 [Brassica cretica]|uniref:Uncharacterized protein n=1 Tax=Brassica cretica TaxID=69181 RepID=A0ABQ7EAL5_BRACR|nr:hypothetical protein DY000_02027157 [Brassica cretica]
MFGFAWKDLIWTMQGGNGFEISPHANSLQFHMNIQSLNTQENESLEKAINLFALHMMCEQANPAVIFSNWDKLDQYTKTIIIYSARKKCYMLMAYTEGVDLKSFLSSNIPHVGASTLETKDRHNETDTLAMVQTVLASCISSLCYSFNRCLCLTKDDPEDSSISELDFIKNIVEVVNGLLGRIALKDSNNTTTPQIYTGEASNQAVLDVNQLNELLHLSETKAPEAVNLDRFFRTGFMFGFAWKDLIWTMQGGNGFEISPHANSLQFHMNIQSLNTQENKSLEKAINLFALHMMCEQANPAVIFSNWDKLDQYTKTIIIYSARKKCYMLMAYTEPY